MNKLTKVGLSALCGTLASVAAANAGTMEVLGGATVTHTSNGKTVTGNPLGMNTALTFKGSGELDNGSTFTLTVTGADQDGYTSGNINIVTPSMGSFKINSRTGGIGLGGYDDVMPTAWEETWGFGMGTGIDLPKGVSSSMSLGYTSPTVAGMTLKAAYTPKNDATFVNDKAVSGATAANLHSGYDVVLDINPSFGIDALSGLNIFVGGSETVVDKEASLSKGNTQDRQEGIGGAVFSYGPVSIGYQRSVEFSGLETAGSTEYYQNNIFGVSFNINDNLSISYGDVESRKHKVGSGASDKNVIMSAESFQIAYTMGGMSIKVADGEVSNASYGTASSSDYDGRTIALSLAF